MGYPCGTTDSVVTYRHLTWPTEGCGCWSCCEKRRANSPAQSAQNAESLWGNMGQSDGQKPDSIRQFDTGATRSNDALEHDYEGFMSPLVVRAFGEYMTKHRTQPDGSIRDSDNWQKGIPMTSYIKSLFRHFVDLWLFHRGFKGRDTIKDALCGIMFNCQGYLHELLKKESK